jgi:hypothetical protein
MVLTGMCCDIQFMTIQRGTVTTGFSGILGIKGLPDIAVFGY